MGQNFCGVQVSPTHSGPHVPVTRLENTHLSNPPPPRRTPACPISFISKPEKKTQNPSLPTLLLAPAVLVVHPLYWRRREESQPIRLDLKHGEGKQRSTDRAHGRGDLLSVCGTDLGELLCSSRGAGGGEGCGGEGTCTHLPHSISRSH